MSWYKVANEFPSPGTLVHVSDGITIHISSWNGKEWDHPCPYIDQDEIVAWRDLIDPPRLWWSLDENEPQEGTDILAEIEGPKLFRYKQMNYSKKKCTTQIIQWTYVHPELEKGY